MGNPEVESEDLLVFLIESNKSNYRFFDSPFPRRLGRRMTQQSASTERREHDSSLNKGSLIE
jgi:hypothetical protein